MPGIYKFDGESLIICVAYNGVTRPTDFTAPKASKRRLTTYKRAPRLGGARSAGDRAYMHGEWSDGLTIDAGGRFRLGRSAGRYMNDALEEPHTIDFTYETGPGAGQTDRGIYKFEGDVLVVCLG